MNRTIITADEFVKRLNVTDEKEICENLIDWLKKNKENIVKSYESLFFGKPYFSLFLSMSYLVVKSNEIVEMDDEMNSLVFDIYEYFIVSRTSDREDLNKTLMDIELKEFCTEQNFPKPNSKMSPSLFVDKRISFYSKYMTHIDNYKRKLQIYESDFN